MKTEGDKKDPVLSVALSDGYFLRSKSTAAAMGLISEAVTQKTPVILVTGPYGIGTSRLIQEWSLEQSDDLNIKTISEPEQGPDEIMRQVADLFGLNVEDATRTVLVSELRKHLLDAAKGGKSSVLIVDNADYVSSDAMELLKVLASVKHNRKTLLRVIFVGRPKLLEKMRVADRPAEAARIAFVTLAPFDNEDCRELLTVAVGQTFGQDVTVEPDAAEAVFIASQGRPGLVLALVAELKSSLAESKPTKITSGDVLGLDGLQEQDDDCDGDSLEDNSKLPRSIRDSEDPRALLRFALNNASKQNEGFQEETPKAPAPKTPVPPKTATPPDDMPADLNSALAQLAEEEQATIREGGKIQALPPQRQEGRPAPMKLEGPIGAAARAPKGDPKPLGDDANTLQESDQFEFNSSSTSAEPSLAEPSPKQQRPLKKIAKVNRPVQKNAVDAAVPTPNESNAAPQEPVPLVVQANTSAKSRAVVHDPTKLREIIRSFDDEPEPDTKRRSYVPLVAGMAAVAAAFVAYPFVLGPNGIAPLGSSSIEQAEVSRPNLPQDPNATAGFPDQSTASEWETKKNAQLPNEIAPAPEAILASLVQPKRVVAPVQDIEAAARPDPVRLSARSDTPGVRPVRVNPLQAEDASSLASSIALQATDSELANSLRLKEVAEREIASLIGELSQLRNEVKTLRAEKSSLSEGLAGTQEQLASLKQEAETARVDFEQERTALDAARAEREQIESDLLTQADLLKTRKADIAALEAKELALQSELTASTDALGRAQDEVSSQQEILAGLAEQIEAGSAQSSEISRALEQGRIDLAALDQKANASSQNLSETSAALDAARQEQEALLSANADLRERNSTIESRLTTMSTALVSAEQALKNVELEKTSLQASLDADTKAALVELERLTAENGALSSQIATLQDEIEVARADKRTAQQNADALKAESSELLKALDVARAQSQEYEARRAQAEQVLAGLTPQIAQAQSDLEATQLELAQRDEALSQELADTRSKIASMNAKSAELQSEIESLTADAEQAALQKQELSRETALLSETRDAVLASQAAAMRELESTKDKLSQTAKALADAAADRTRIAGQFEEETRAMDERLLALRAENETLTAQSEDLSRQIERATAQRADLEGVLTSLQGSIEETENQLAAAQSDYERTRQEMAQLKGQFADLQSAIANNRAEREQNEKTAALRLAAIESETEALLQTRDAVQDDIATLTQKVDVARQDEISAKTLLDEIRESIAKTEIGAATAKQELADLQKEMRSAETALQTLRAEAGQVETEIADLRNLQDAEIAQLAKIEARVETAQRSAILAAEFNRLEELELESRKLARNQIVDEESAAALASGPRPRLLLDPLYRKPTQLAALDIKRSRPEIGDIAPRPTPTAATSSLRTREEDVVAAALSRAPGLGNLSGREREALKTELINGTCIPEALRKVTGTINRQTLRALIRRMDRCTS